MTAFSNTPTCWMEGLNFHYLGIMKEAALLRMAHLLAVLRIMVILTFDHSVQATVPVVTAWSNQAVAGALILAIQAKGNA